MPTNFADLVATSRALIRLLEGQGTAPTLRPMFDFETLLYREEEGVAWVTLNRPDVHNAFNFQMQRELKELWEALRRKDDVRCIVLTGAGDKAFCVGLDRSELVMGEPTAEQLAARTGAGVVSSTPWQFDDPGDNIGPKTNGLWKPMVVALNGMACAGGFYLLGEAEFIIAAENVTFFDPHVTFGMTACMESMHMLQKMPFHEIMRLALLGSAERLSVQRAYQIGLVSEIVPREQLEEAAGWAARQIASWPPLATQGTVRSIWAARELSRTHALDMGRMIVRLGTDDESIAAGQRAFSSGDRVPPRIR
jgi:enoyl-CoA hydratase/carnithine racemase